MLQLKTKKMKIDEIVDIYSSFQDERHEILMGLGNAWYNEGLIIKAEENYLKALNLRRT